MKVAGDVFELASVLFICDEFRVEFDGAVIRSGGIIEEEIEVSVFDLFFDAVFVGHAEKVFSGKREEEVDLSLSDILPVQDKCFYPKTTLPLQSHHYAVVHDGEAVQNAIHAINALQL